MERSVLLSQSKGGVFTEVEEHRGCLRHGVVIWVWFSGLFEMLGEECFLSQSRGGVFTEVEEHRGCLRHGVVIWDSFSGLLDVWV